MLKAVRLSDDNHMRLTIETHTEVDVEYYMCSITPVEDPAPPSGWREKEPHAMVHRATRRAGQPPRLTAPQLAC